MNNMRVIIEGKMARSIDKLVDMSDCDHDQIVRALIKAGLRHFTEELKKEVMNEAVEQMDVWRN